MELVTLKQLLNEISSRDAFAKFYSEIPEDIYNEAMAQQPTMTVLHKKVLNTLLDDGKNYNSLLSAGDNETAEKIKMEMWMLAHLLGDNWPKLTPEKKTMAVEDAEFLKKDRINILDLNKIFSDASNMKWHNQSSISKDGLVIVFENEYWRITCTTTYAASVKNYGDSKWCTASDLEGRLSGWEMFKSYIEGDNYEVGKCLVQFIDKEDRSRSYQAAVYENSILHASDCCDFQDNPVDWGEVMDFLKEEEDLDLQQIFTGEFSTYNLVRLTAKNNTQEKLFMDRYIKRRANTIVASNKISVKNIDIEQVNKTISAYNKGKISEDACLDEHDVYYPFTVQTTLEPDYIDKRLYIVNVLPQSQRDGTFLKNNPTKDIKGYLSQIYVVYDKHYRTVEDILQDNFTDKTPRFVGNFITGLKNKVINMYSLENGEYTYYKGYSQIVPCGERFAALVHQVDNEMLCDIFDGYKGKIIYANSNGIRKENDSTYVYFMPKERKWGKFSADWFSDDELDLMETYRRIIDIQL